MTTTHTEIKVLWIGLLSTLNIVLNGIVVAAITKYPQLLEDRTNLFMISLMTADILYGTLVMPLSAGLCSSAGQYILAAIPYLPNIVMLYSRAIAIVGINSLRPVNLCQIMA